MGALRTELDTRPLEVKVVHADADIGAVGLIQCPAAAFFIGVELLVRSALADAGRVEEVYIVRAAAILAIIAVQ